MARQMYVIPDSDGVIRVSCGGDQLEIHILSVASSAHVGRNPPPPKPGTAAAELVVLLDQLGTGSPNSPVTWLYDPPRTPEGKIDTEKVYEEARRQFADPNRPDPLAILLSAKEVNLHEISDISERIAKTANLSLAVDFGGLLKR